MALNQDTLRAQLVAMPNVDNEPAARANMASAFDVYFRGASVAPVMAASAALTPARTAMQAALVGLSVPGNGATAIQAGIVAYWGAVVASAAVIWVHSPPVLSVTPPPSLSTLASVLAPLFTSLTAAKLSKAECCAQLAAAIHTLQLGGQAAVGPPPATIPVL